ncbi:DUF1206 domain-containing protein [Microbacterium immunditiarum]|uniref:DUF1206 domain-containing protein n=1 Tax=Microbacterium immunditiarum TaxID=337480 RepID=A0A7Y9GQP6_9MICO|nr:DUF1206 domain-containing protein [Microbacterium immunditiarum]NYE20851.1 hypothetical protein [Microbacterium immunditiarum]
MSAPTVKRAARDAQDNTVFRRIARAGYAANGVVHILVGVVFVVVAFGGDGESDQAGAFKAVGAAPLGFVGLWLIAITLWALGAYHALEGILAWGGDAARKWGRRVAQWGQAVAFIAVGVLAAAVAIGARPDPDEAAEDASRGVLAIPGGPFILGAIGVGIGIAGIAFVVMGVRRSFRNRMTIPDSALGASVTALGVAGFVAKGIALLIVAVLLIVAAVRVDPEGAGGLDAAVDALIAMRYGPPLVASVGVGLIAYGIFCLFRAPYADL